MARPRVCSPRRESQGTGNDVRVRVKPDGLRFVPASELVPAPDNWKQHPDPQRRALRGLLRDVGFADVLLAREGSDGRLHLFDGHLRREEMGDLEVPVVVCDLSEAEAEKMMLGLDPTAAMSTADVDALRLLLDRVQTADQDVADLLTSLADQFEAVQFPPDPIPPTPAQAPREPKTVTCPDCGREFSPT